MDEKEVKKLFPKIQTRLGDYGENNYQPLASIISKYFIMAGSEMGDAKGGNKLLFPTWNESCSVF